MNYSLFKWIHGMAGHNKLIDDVMIFATKDALYVFALVLICMWLFTSHKKSVLYAGIAGIMGLILNLVISHIYYEPRPFVTHHVHLLIPHTVDASFPSDHATGTFAIALTLWIRNKKTGFFMTLFALLTGISRVWVGHHYPFDIVGSVIVAGVTTYIINKCSRWIDPIIQFIIHFYCTKMKKIVQKVQ